MKVEVYYINGTMETIEVEDGDAIEPDPDEGILNLWSPLGEEKRYCIPYCNLLKWVEIKDKNRKEVMI